MADLEEQKDATGEEKARNGTESKYGEDQRKPADSLWSGALGFMETMGKDGHFPKICKFRQ